MVPGPVGLFRKSTIEQIKGLTEDRKIFAEDAEMSLRVISLGWQIYSEERMIASTEAPNDILSLLRQRYRWNRGTFQALTKNFMGMLRSKSHLARFLAVHLYIETWAVPMLNTVLIYNFMVRLLIYRELNYFTIWLTFGIFLDLWVLIASTLRRGRFFQSLWVMILSKFFYDYLLFFWKVFSFFDEWRDQSMGWDKLSRHQKLREVKYG